MSQNQGNGADSASVEFEAGLRAARAGIQREREGDEYVKGYGLGLLVGEYLAGASDDERATCEG